MKLSVSDFRLVLTLKPAYQNTKMSLMTARERNFQKQTAFISVLMSAVKNLSKNGFCQKTLDQSSSFSRRTLDIPAKVGYNLNNAYDVMTVFEINTLTQICEIERAQNLIALSLAQTNLSVAGYLL